jgi:predicted nuclease of predicted toxin-antitoxin system
MRRVLVDKCLPVQLHRWLEACEVRTVAFMGWKGRRNSELLEAVRDRFDVLLTSDRLLPREHDLASYGIGIVVVTTNRLRDVERLVPETREAVARVSPGEQIVLPDESIQTDH